VATTDLKDQLQAALGASYTLERELGRGGMATVFLAQDVKHRRRVALKVLHPDLAASLGAERFRREIELAAQLQHPHILTVLDSGEAAGQMWFTMPYIEGESLRHRLTRERQLSVSEALRIAREAARALDYAHRQGIIHRDIKPENILLTKEGDTLVADFGIGRALNTAGGSDRLTDTGMVVGTPSYMSPEQAAGERQLDGRTDIYSLGAVLFEMLAGEPPFTGATAQAVIAKRLAGAAPSVRQVRPAVPEPVEQTVRTALAPVPADRFATAADFARALEPPVGAPAGATTAAAKVTGETVSRGGKPGATLSHARPRVPVAAVLVLGFMLGLGVLFAWRHTHPSDEAAATTGPKRLAVLPFENLGTHDQDYFADGITDEIRGKLAGLPGLQVTASNSSSQYKATSKTPQQIGQELGVQYLLIGKVRWEKGAGQSRVRVSPELVQVATASTKWEQPFDAALTDVFQVQADVAARVAQALNVALGAGEREALSGKPTTNLAAYDAYLKGNEAAAGFDQVTPVELKRAVEFYERAVALDSGFALAWAQLSRAHSLVYYTGTPTTADADRAHMAAQRALALAADLGEVHLALGDYYNFVKQDWPRALDEYSAGRKLAPSNAELLKGVGLVERSQGRWEESQAALKQAQTLDPRSIATARRLTVTLLWLRRYPEALQSADRALTLDTRAPDLHATKIMIYLAQGDLAGAHDVLAAAERVVEPTTLVAWMAEYWDLFWVLTDAQQQLLLRLDPDQFGNDRAGWALALAETYWLRGDRARAQQYADSARIASLDQIKDAPNDAQRYTVLALSLAYLGKKADAIRQGEHSVALSPITKDAYTGAYTQHQLVRVYLLVGEPGKALDRLEPLLKVPYYLSPGFLKVDPGLAPLRGNPRFERLIAGNSGT
jgi:eukaryotic-like serine/threonine-protein kinase